MNRPALLLLLPVLVAGCAGGGSKDLGTVTATGVAAAQNAQVGMTNTLRFSPNVVKAKVGTLTLTAANLGTIPHNLVFDQAALGQTKTVNGGQSESVTVVFSRPGTFSFTCTFHSGMDGRVVVS